MTALNSLRPTPPPTRRNGCDEQHMMPFPNKKAAVPQSDLPLFRLSGQSVLAGAKSRLGAIVIPWPQQLDANKQGLAISRAGSDACQCRHFMLQSVHNRIDHS